VYDAVTGLLTSEDREEDDLYAAIDLLADKLDRQVLRYKDKRSTDRHLSKDKGIPRPGNGEEQP